MVTAAANVTASGRSRRRPAAADRQHTEQVVPATFGARLDDVRAQLGVAGVQLTHLLGGRDAAALGGQTSPEHVGDEFEIRLFADRAPCAGLCSDVARRPDELRMRVADLVERKAPLLHLT